MPFVQGWLFAHPNVALHQKIRESRAVLRAHKGMHCVLVQHAMAAALQLRVLFCVCMPGCRALVIAGGLPVEVCQGAVSKATLLF